MPNNFTLTNTLENEIQGLSGWHINKTQQIHRNEGTQLSVIDKIQFTSLRWLRLFQSPKAKEQTDTFPSCDEPFPRANRSKYIKLLPVTDSTEYYQNGRPCFKGRIGFPKETFATATLFCIGVDQRGNAEFIKLNDVTFSLDRLEWMTMELPQEVKDILLSLLNVKTDIACQIVSINKKICSCEEIITEIYQLVEAKCRVNA